MANKTSLADKYLNRAYARIDMTAVDTVTFQQIRFSTGLFEGIALVLNRIKYYPLVTTLRAVAADTDYWIMALTTRDDLTSLDPNSLSVLDTVSSIGVGAGVEPVQRPIISDFTNAPGGGLLIPANPLYLAMDTAGFGAVVGGATVVLEYQFIKLSDKESLELLQTIIPGTT